MKKITIYKDLDHQQKAEIEQVLAISPEKRIAFVVSLIKKIYPNVRSNTTKKITFHK